MIFEPWLVALPDAEAMRAADRWAIDEQGVPSLELMERAGAGLAALVMEVAPDGPVAIVCGKGNNGGDGLVTARALREMGFEVDALLLGPGDQLSEDARANLERFDGAREVGVGDLPAALEGAGVIVDAIFGTGFAGAPRDPARSAIDAINDADATVVATDIASGVNASTGEVEGKAVRAHVTVTFHAPKLGHWIAPGKEHTGKLRVAPIGIPEGPPVEATAGVIGTRVLELAPHRAAGSTKFSSGQVVVVGGSRGLTGAVCLSALGAIRSGAGYATVAVPADLESIFEIKLTEVMSLGCASREGRLRPAASEQILGATERAASVVLGSGMGREQGTQRLARELTQRIRAPLVLDADGLNAHAGRIESLADREGPLVLTPHEGEMGRLLDRDSSEIKAKRLESARETAERSGAIVLLKGDDSIVADGERVAVNAVSSPQLATAGTGDVLTGVIAALIARGLEPFAATCAAVVAHSRAGRAAGERVGHDSVIAGDVIEAMPAGLAV
ncbi:MAG TPA: NAD(P)H-hydrate dehydratase [Solirubrobacterales bacterium]|nr:NAD(P)H-hydrate dehydratase [Solirubrobacterales bacterium]